MCTLTGRDARGIQTNQIFKEGIDEVAVKSPDTDGEIERRE